MRTPTDARNQCAVAGLEESRDAGNVCPLLVEGLCTAREHRFLGCRTYFCQPGWDELGDAIYAAAYEAIKAIGRRLDEPWAYRPALDQLREA